MKYLNGMYSSEADDFGDGWFSNVFPKSSKHGNVLREKNLGLVILREQWIEV